MQRPENVVDFEPDPAFYPFESKWFESSVGPVHYVDEGEGRPLVMFHGNPDWSFLYRKIITALKDNFRCIAVDYPGFGLSVHPESGYGYTPAEHAVVIGELIAHLDLTDMVIMGQDWGGPISLQVASTMPERVGGLVIGNTWFWPVDGAKMRSFVGVMSSRPLQSLIIKRNFFVTMMKLSLKVKLPAAELDHFARVIPTEESRKGVAIFPKEIRASAGWLAELEKRVTDNLASTPLLLTWGMKDFAFNASFLDDWIARFPHATVVRLEKAGHYIQEDAPDEISQAILEKYGS